MGVFDFFLNSDRKTQTARNTQPQKVFNYSESQTNSDSSTAMEVFFPKSYEEVSDIIDVLVLGKAAVVNIKDLKDATSQRVLDLLSGAIYALHGNLGEIDKGIYVFSASGVKIK